MPYIMTQSCPNLKSKQNHMEKVKEYQSGDVTVLWKPGKCMHSENCWRGLPDVFRPKDKPWIQPEKADQTTLTSQIDKCPSGALSYRLEGQMDLAKPDRLKIKVTKDGPYLLKQDVIIELPDGNKEVKESAIALCRCGASSNKPYCDGTHKKISFKG